MVCSWSSSMPVRRSVQHPPPFPDAEARAEIDVLLAGIKEGQATMDPRGELECVVLLDHGRLLALLSSEHATYGVDQLWRFMASHRDELDAAHKHCDRALAEWADLQEHMVSTFFWRLACSCPAGYAHLVKILGNRLGDSGSAARTKL